MLIKIDFWERKCLTWDGRFKIESGRRSKITKKTYDHKFKHLKIG